MSPVCSSPDAWFVVHLALYHSGVGYTNLAMFSGVAEMIARILVSLYAVPVFGFIAVCYGDPMAWIAADLFLVPAFIYVYRRLKKQVFTNSQVTQTVA